MVGYAMASRQKRLETPWQRVINSQGEISIRANGEEDDLQYQLLSSEGIIFNDRKIELAEYLFVLE
jgi:methylated-DNA-protein-cysteine methyltransferase-like protein